MDRIGSEYIRENVHVRCFGDREEAGTEVVWPEEKQWIHEKQDAEVGSDKLGDLEEAHGGDLWT